MNNIILFYRISQLLVLVIGGIFGLFITYKFYEVYQEHCILNYNQKVILLEIDKIKSRYLSKEDFDDFVKNLEQKQIENIKLVPLKEGTIINKNSGLIPREIRGPYLKDSEK